MSGNPLVLALHFGLELAALVALGYSGWTISDGVQRWVWAIALPLLLATVWAVFRVPNDGGDPIIVVPGIVRLAIELAFFGIAVVLLFAAGQQTWAFVLLALVVFDYALAYDRVARLLGIG